MPEMITSSQDGCKRLQTLLAYEEPELADIPACQIQSRSGEDPELDKITDLSGG